MKNCKIEYYRKLLQSLKYTLSGRMEIHPCVLQDIGPLGPLPCSHSTSSAITPCRASGTADHVQSLDDLLSIKTWISTHSQAVQLSELNAAPLVKVGLSITHFLSLALFSLAHRVAERYKHSTPRS